MTYESWESYKANFIEKYKNFTIQDLPNEFKTIPTFRKQENEDWSGTKVAFEQSLVDIGINWFIYIKFYIDKNNGTNIPLVIGKTGSMNVNDRDSDISFSINIKDGPARRFLYEENLEWNKEVIAVLPCKSEQDAYEKEKFYQSKLKLFGS